MTSKYIAVLMIFWGGCYSVEYPKSYPCSATSSGCPEGQVCNGFKCVANAIKKDGGSGDQSKPDLSVEPALCGDNRITGTEVCDGALLGNNRCENHGFTRGELRCGADCHSFDTRLCSRCGDHKQNDNEGCDGDDFGDQSCQSLDFTGGKLNCTLDCEIDTSECGNCNDGRMDPEEQCDLQDFRGQSCLSLGHHSGWLICTDTCTIDESWCSDFPCNHNFIKDPDEQCDGKDLGSLTCESLGYPGGGWLNCTENCTADVSQCNNAMLCDHDSIRDPGEQCDETDFGPDTCATYGIYGNGYLTCNNDCTVNLTYCYCPPSLTECNGECVDLLTDNRFCNANGTCGPGCAPGDICNGAGICVPQCPSGLTDCGGQCVNTTNDPSNCGGCDYGTGTYTCAYGTEACINSQCQSTTYLLPTAATDIYIGASSVVVEGTRAYITTGFASPNTYFRVLDVANPLNPAVLGSVNHGYADPRVEAHAIHNNIVWCVRSSSGGYGAATYLFGVDVSDPTNPVIRGSLTLQTGTSLISRVSRIYAGYLLVHDYSDNLIYVIDISNPDAPAKYSSWAVPNMVNGGPGNMMIEGNLLYLAAGENFTLRIYDLTNLAAVSQVGFVSTGNEQQFGNPVKIGPYVYVETNIYLGDSFLKVIDVSNPASPTVVGSVPPLGSLKQRNGRLFGFSYGPTVYALSLADPKKPVVEASSDVTPAPPSTSLNVYFMSDPGANWVGNYLIGMTHGSDSYHGVRALNFPVN